MIDPYTTAGATLGSFFGAALGCLSKDLELDFHDALAYNALSLPPRSYVKTVIPEALKDRTFWQITLCGALIGAGLGKTTFEIQELILSMLS